MAADTRTALMEGALARDFAAVKEHGWWPVFTSLSSWWARRFDVENLVPYADLLGEENPQAIVSALRELVGGDWPPSASDVYRQLQADKAQIAAQVAKRAEARPDLHPVALARVRMLVEKGEPVCECIPRGSNVFIDGVGVMTCPDCGALEPGQVDNAGEP